MLLTFGGVSGSPQHHHPKDDWWRHRGASQDWLKAWKAWAATRKKGKLAKCIVQKLEDNVSLMSVNVHYIM